MSQQLGIIVMIDVPAAIKAKSLKGHIYMMDNLKPEGSTGQGTSNLISHINGTHWSDGSQAEEQVFNWLFFAIGSLPPTLPQTFLMHKSSMDERTALEHLSHLLNGGDDAKDREILNNIRDIQTSFLGMRSQIKNSHGHVREMGHKLLDVTGSYVLEDEIKSTGVSHPEPVVTRISGEAVDEGIIFDAQYGYPDLATDGWYWSASISTYQPGLYSYLMHITLFSLDESGIWIPHYFTHPGKLKITSQAKINGFTGGAMGILPINN